MPANVHHTMSPGSSTLATPPMAAAEASATLWFPACHVARNKATVIGNRAGWFSDLSRDVNLIAPSSAVADERCK